MDQVYQTGEPFHAPEFEQRIDRGPEVPQRLWIAVTIAPLRENGKVTGVINVAVEVTEQVFSRHRIEQLRETAERASRAKDEFVTVLSHELRTPLTAIVGWSAMLRSGRVPEAKVPTALETIERNARAQARLIDDLLDVSRIEQGKLVLDVGPVELARVVAAALDAVRPAAEAKAIRIQPVLDSDAVVLGDPNRLQQIVWNLLSNAIKFTPRGGSVQVALRRDPSHVELTVADTGVGIGSERLPRVFERFWQADASVTRRHGGLGLGLSIVRSLVELHGGEVSAFSPGEGGGAMFVVRLPIAPVRSELRDPISEPPPDDSSAPELDCPPELSGARVLVVDDEPETRALLQYVLEQCGADVTTAASGREALERLGDGSRIEVLVSRTSACPRWTATRSSGELARWAGQRARSPPWR